MEIKVLPSYKNDVYIVFLLHQDKQLYDIKTINRINKECGLPLKLSFGCMLTINNSHLFLNDNINNSNIQQRFIGRTISKDLLKKVLITVDKVNLFMDGGKKDEKV